MKSPHCTRFVLLAATLLAWPSYAETLHGRVVGVTDGNTVTVLDTSNTERKIRLMGIDAPEKKQAFGSKSKEFLSTLVFNKQGTVEYSTRDRNGRTVEQARAEKRGLWVDATPTPPWDWRHRKR